MIKVLNDRQYLMLKVRGGVKDRHLKRGHAARGSSGRKTQAMHRLGALIFRQRRQSSMSAMVHGVSYTVMYISHWLSQQSCWCSGPRRLRRSLPQEYRALGSSLWWKTFIHIIRYVLSFTYVKGQRIIDAFTQVFMWNQVVRVTQNLSKVFWSGTSSGTLIDSGITRSSGVCLMSGPSHTSFNMVAKLDDVKKDGESSREIILEINMLRAELGPTQQPVDDNLREVDDDRLKAIVDHQVRRTGTSGKFFDNLRPPEFTGERHELEAWSQRFTWYIRNKSAVFADIIKDVANMPPGMSLAALGFWAARQSHSLTTATATIQMGLELHGYLQSALQASGLDRTLLPQAQSNGFEVWRLLHDRFKPHTATTALVDLREIVFNTDLLSEGNFTQAPGMGA